MNTTKLLVTVIVLQGLMLLGQWTGHSAISAAQAQVPDALNQKGQIADELKELNSKVDKLVELLQSGNVQVKVVPADEKK